MPYSDENENISIWPLRGNSLLIPEWKEKNVEKEKIACEKPGYGTFSKTNLSRQQRWLAVGKERAQ